ncbi:hypothetical protein A1I_07135 [Rickettsia bellii OSU 85-389]|nr:hypothetical protein A1I_07135 [Rickettsia bellii OSU 85-389]
MSNLAPLLINVLIDEIFLDSTASSNGVLLLL